MDKIDIKSSKTEIFALFKVLTAIQNDETKELDEDDVELVSELIMKGMKEEEIIEKIFGKNKSVEEDYKPTNLEIKQSQKKEKYSDSEGSAEEESLTYSVDQSGFYQLEFSDSEGEET